MKRTGIFGFVALAFAFSTGCADVDPLAETRAYTPEKATETAPSTEIKSVKKEKAASGLTEKGTTLLSYGYTHIENVTVQPNETITYTTSKHPQYNDVDTMIALFWRTDDAKELFVPKESSTKRISLWSLAIDDDTAGNLYSTVTWTNETGSAKNIFCTVFAFGNVASAKVANLSFNNGTPKLVEVRAGSQWVETSNAGRIWTNYSTPGHGSYLGPFLIALENPAPIGYNSAANNDDADSSPGGDESDINGFVSGKKTLVIGHASGYRSQGYTNLYY
jgi:hypothetical protein